MTTFWTLLNPRLTFSIPAKSLFQKSPKSDPEIVQKITQIAVILRETDSWLDSQNIHMKFVQILAMQVFKRKMKNIVFRTLLNPPLELHVPAGTLFYQECQKRLILRHFGTSCNAENRRKCQ